MNDEHDTSLKSTSSQDGTTQVIELVGNSRAAVACTLLTFALEQWGKCAHPGEAVLHVEECFSEALVAVENNS